MKLIIDRKLWARGEGDDNSSLLRDDGKMCCLGFYGLACGITPDAMRCIGTPDNLYRTTLKVMADWLVYIRPDSARMLKHDVQNTFACKNLMQWNDAFVSDEEDDQYIASEEKRERLIAEEFAKHGVEVEFIN